MSAAYDVFHIDGERGMRGGERQLLYLAAALRARGHRNTVVCRRGGALAGSARKQGFAVLELPFLLEWDPLTALPLKRAAASAQRPILHAHTAHAAGVAALAGWLGGPPSVMHRRVDFPLRGGMSRRIKYGSAARVVAASKAIRDQLVDQGLAAKTVSVVTDGIPVNAEECGWVGMKDDQFTPPSAEEKNGLRRALIAELHLPSQAVLVGNLAALVPHKDHDTLLAAAVIVLLKRPEAVFLIAGEGPERGRLAESITRMGLAGRVLLLGQREAVPLLKALDIFVLSSWGEGMGSVLLEAGAVGLPIAATRAGGIPEVVDDGRGGLLSAPRDPEALARNILRLMDDRPAARRMAAACRGELHRFGLARMAREVEAIYAEASPA